MKQTYSKCTCPTCALKFASCLLHPVSRVTFRSWLCTQTKMRRKWSMELVSLFVCLLVLLCVCVVCLRVYLRRTVYCRVTDRLDDKTVLITGRSSVSICCHITWWNEICEQFARILCKVLFLFHFAYEHIDNILHKTVC